MAAMCPWLIRLGTGLQKDVGPMVPVLHPSERCHRQSGSSPGMME